MKIARFRADRKVGFGVVEGEELVEIRGSAYMRFRKTDIRYSLSRVKLLPPAEAPQIWCPGRNFPDRPSGLGRGQAAAPPTLPAHPEPWQKSANALTGPGDPIIIPKDSAGEVHFEGEAVAVIGKTCRRVTPQQAHKFILGYTCGNNVSEWAWEKEDVTTWRAKGADSFAPVGPWVETCADPQALEIIVRLNSNEVQRSCSQHMRFSFAQIISYISQQVTLRPGDLVFSGAPAGTQALRPGDVVEVEIPGVGLLRNPVVAEFDSSK
jgi:2-keto-4-pentenoate hydratase/2-oxohepta-3-ene-1,7-dioic acid hydratase in catechol pathway